MQKKIEREVYSSMDEFAADMELMVENARTFNEEESDIVRWAKQLLVWMRKGHQKPSTIEVNGEAERIRCCFSKKRPGYHA